MKKWLLHPFTYTAGAASLAAGTAGMLFTAVIAYYSHTHYDGVLDTHIGAPAPAVTFVLEPLICWLCATLTFYAGGLLFSPTKPRLVDMAGTLALSRMALLPAALIAFLQPPVLSPMDLPPAAWLVIMVILLCTIWLVVLLYQAFTVSANMKGTKAALVFTGTLIVAEILSKTALHFIYASL